MPEQPSLPPVLTVAEVARYLRISETTVWRWCSSGKLPAFRIGRAWRVHRTDLDALMHTAGPGRAQAPAVPSPAPIPAPPALLPSAEEI